MFFQANILGGQSQFPVEPLRRNRTHLHPTVRNFYFSQAKTELLQEIHLLYEFTNFSYECFSFFMDNKYHMAVCYFPHIWLLLEQ